MTAREKLVLELLAVSADDDPRPMRALRAFEGASEEPLLTRQALAERLGCSLAQVTKLQLHGMPEHLRIGAHPRFVLSEVLPWLRKREPCEA